MKVLIMGGSGMLGHKLWQTFQGRFDTFVTVRREFAHYEPLDLFKRERTIDRLSALDNDSVRRAVETVRPDVVVNAVGLVKQEQAAQDSVTAISVNSLFPHLLAGVCRASGARLIHISTDCVFSGAKGNYSEADPPDPPDLYGRTKLLGEVEDTDCLTLRTSMIGRELRSTHGLVEWFLSQQGKTIRGFRRAVFSGFTTVALAEIIARLIVDRRDLQGIWHVAAEPIDKFTLLSLVKDVYGLDVGIEPDESFLCDRSLDATRFRCATGFVIPTWPDMIRQMYQDATPYEQIRRAYAHQ